MSDTLDLNALLILAACFVWGRLIGLWLAHDGWRLALFLRWVNFPARLRERRDYERWLARIARDPAIREACTRLAAAMRSSGVTVDQARIALDRARRLAS